MINTGKEMEEILKNISSNDLDKLRLLLSIIPGCEPKEVVTLRVFIEEYKNIIQHNRSSSYLRSVVVALNYLVDYFSFTDHKPGLKKSIASIELRDVENFLIYLQQKVSKGYVVYYRNLKAAFNKAKDWDYVKENYFTKVKLQKKQKLAPVFVNGDQLSAIGNQLKNEVIKDFAVFGFYTGMRLNEIINLRWKNVDLQNLTITVGDESFTTKGRNQRYIPICEEALEALLRMKNPPNIRRTSAESTKNMSDKCIVKNINPLCPSGISPLKKGGEVSSFVFCKKDGSKYCGNYVSRKFKNACIATGMNEAIHFHSLRHSFASNLVQKGVPLYTIKELLGHSSISTTEIYSHLNMDSLREAIKKLDNRPHPDPLPKGEGEKRLQIFSINSGEKR